MKIKTKIKMIAAMILASVVLILIFPKTDWESSSGYAALDSPLWLDQEINTDAHMVPLENGPVVYNEKDSYEILKIFFYDAASQKQITDKKLINELLSMFQYTEDSFVYSEEYSTNGTCFFYYNGVLEAEKKVSLFNGFQGRPDFDIEKISVNVHSFSVCSDDIGTLEEAITEAYKY